MAEESPDLRQTSSTALGTAEPVGGISPLEAKAYRKFDKYLLPQLALVIILAYLDRTNIG